MVEKRLFGTFGVRRTANDVLTPEFASRLAASYGSIVQGTVAIGGYTRTSTPMLKYAITAGLLSSGCDVVDLGILPTPGVQYAVRKYYDGGVWNKEAALKEIVATAEYPAQLRQAAANILNLAEQNEQNSPKLKEYKKLLTNLTDDTTLDYNAEKSKRQ